MPTPGRSSLKRIRTFFVDLAEQDRFTKIIGGPTWLAEGDHLDNLSEIKWERSDVSEQDLNEEHRPLHPEAQHRREDAQSFSL